MSDRTDDLMARVKVLQHRITELEEELKVQLGYINYGKQCFKDGIKAAIKIIKMHEKFFTFNLTDKVIKALYKEIEND
jgi:hypothetical protein